MRWLTLLLALAALVVGLFDLSLAGGADLPAASRLHYVSRYTDFDSLTTKKAIVLCPEGERLLYGGGSVGYPWRMPEVVTSRSIPFSEDGREGWWYVASETVPRAAPWEAFAVAVCVKPG